MKSPLHILHLEDDPNDAELVQSTLKTGGIPSEIVCVETRNDFVAALERGSIDLILSDFGLPTFDGLSAAKMVRSRWPAIPLILVSGTMGEEMAIDSVHSGATDYVLKERLSRLVPAVRRAMLEVEARAERRRLEEQLIQSQKMEAIGQLAGGLAHDFNNLLHVISGNSELIALKMPLDAETQELLAAMNHASKRGSALTRQLLAFSCQQVFEPKLLNLNPVIADAGKMLRRLIGENVNLTTILEPKLSMVKIDPGQIDQVIMNLVINARDAMPKGGDLTIATSNVELDAAYVRGHPQTPAGHYVSLAVTDTGCGMKPEVQARMFEPFFTTKGPGKGSGLGLAMVYGIVKQSGCHIEARSALGVGTTFQIYLPAKEGFPELISPTVTAKPVQGCETILLVEDEELTRNTIVLLLQHLGYNVLKADNGEEALRLIEITEQKIHLLMTDVVMPGISGLELADTLRPFYPELKILFQSGYNHSTVEGRGMLQSHVNFLQKPYTLNSLASKVRETLDIS